MCATDQHLASLSERRLVYDADVLSIWHQVLVPGEETAWHWHQNVSDRFIVSEGVVAIDTGEDEVSPRLDVGGSFAVPPGIRHRVRNVGEGCATVVTVQTGGRRDFNPAP